MDILVLISKEMISVFEKHLWECLLWVVLCGLYYVEAGSLFAQFSVTFYHESVLNFFKSFSVSIKMIIWNFIPQFVNMVYHIDWFAYNEEFLHPWNKSTTLWCMIALMLLDLICLYFAEDFSICVHQWYWSVIFSFCVLYLCLVWYQCDGDLAKWTWECSSFCSFLEDF